jgi:tRNA threonylcarbamoyladenosine biosynthesis protein TsaB
MIVLGFDTATPATTVALRLADGSTLETRDDPGPGERPGHATRLLGLAGDLLTGLGLHFADLDRIAVGVGPGTFTGLRVGVATARGLAQSLSLELVGISSLQALALAVYAGEPGAAMAADARHGDQPGAGTSVLSVLDARRGEAFAGAYAAPAAGPGPVELSAPRALAPEALGDVLQAARDATGREPAAGDSWLAVGDGAVRFRPELQRLGVDVPADVSRLHRISAAAICELALAADPLALEAVLPDYCRRPDAELALERAAAKAGAPA